MKSLTAAQRETLELLAEDGYQIRDVSIRGTANYRVTNRRGGKSIGIRSTTVDALYQRSYIAHALGGYVITDAGRNALRRDAPDAQR